jgi:hypothetical protein
MLLTKLYTVVVLNSPSRSYNVILHCPPFSRGTLQTQEFRNEFKNKMGHGIAPEICLHKVNRGAHTVINNVLT